MITINNSKFAKNDSEFTNSLFDPNGTCNGFYKVNKRSITLYNQHHEKIGVINRHGVLCCATKQPDGKYWYSYATIPEIGKYNSYMKQVTEIKNIMYEYEVK